MVGPSSVGPAEVLPNPEPLKEVLGTHNVFTCAMRSKVEVEPALRTGAPGRSSSAERAVQGNTYLLYLALLGSSKVLATRLKSSAVDVPQYSFCTNMRLFVSLLIFGLLALIEAISSSGNRLLVVIEEAAEKAKYSTLWKDLEGLLSSAQVLCRLNWRY